MIVRDTNASSESVGTDSSVDLKVEAMYRRQQNKWYPQRCLLANFEAVLNFSRSEFTCS